MTKELLYGKDGLELWKREGGDTTIDSVFVVKVDGFDRHTCDTRAEAVALLIDEIEAKIPVTPVVEYAVCRKAEPGSLAETEIVYSGLNRHDVEAHLLDGCWIEAMVP